jgi:acyl dehydratase
MTDFLYYEDFRAGQIFPLGTHVLKAEEIMDFALEYDPQPQHLDAGAASDILGGHAASGWHLCALAMRMMVDGLFIRSSSLGAPGVDELQWRKPVRAGDTLRLEPRCWICATRPSPIEVSSGFASRCGAMMNG